MNKNILVTGGAGFIGSNLCLDLYKKGYNVTVLDNLSPQVHQEGLSYSFKLIEDKIDFIKGDIRDRGLLKKILPQKDLIIHLAAETGTGQSMYEIEKYVDVNITGTAILMEEVAKTENKPNKIILASSRSVYGEGKYFCEKDNIVYPLKRNKSDLRNGEYEIRCPKCDNFIKPLSTDEASCLNPLSIYASTKLAQENIVKITSTYLGIDWINFRFQNVFGIGQSLSNPYTGIISIFSNLIRNKLDINIFEDGLESRDFIFIDDIVRGIVLAVETDHRICDTLNLGTGIPKNILEIAKILKTELDGNNAIHITGNFREGDIRHNFADLNKVSTQLGFRPMISFEEGIARFINWSKLQPIQKSNYEESINELNKMGLLK